MSRHDWRLELAVGGIALLALATLAQAKEPQWVRIECPPIKEQGASKANRSASQRECGALPVVIVETPERAEAAKTREENSDKHEAADLKAQQDAADAAQRAAATAERQEVPAWVQIWLASVGTVIAVIALVSSILTARSSERTARAQTRAYLSIRPPKVTQFEKGKIVEVDMTADNVGQTPANEVVAYSWVSVAPTPLPADFSFQGPMGKEPLQKYVVMPGAEHTFKTGTSRPFDEEHWNAILAATEVRMYIFGRIEYDDAFGKPHVTEFCFECDKHTFARGQFPMTDRNNKCT